MKASLQTRFLNTSTVLFQADDKGKDESCDEVTTKPDVCEEDKEKKEMAEHVAAKCDPESDDKKPPGKDSGMVLGEKSEGYIHAVIGPVIDVYFPGKVPDVLNAMEVVDAPVEHLVLEVRYNY